MARRVAAAVVALWCLAAHAQVDVDRVTVIGRNALYFEDYVLSIHYFNQAIGAKPWLAQPYFFRAIARLNLEDWLGAEQDATMAIERNPFITDAWEVRGVARQNLGNNPGAVADYARALQDAPRSRGILYNMAMAQQDMGQTDSAAVTFARLLRYHPGFEGGHIGNARLQLEKGDTVSANASLTRAIELNPNSMGAYLLRAELRSARSDSADLPGALSDIDMAVKLNPRLPGLYINRSLIRYRADDYRGAMDDLDYALTLDPANITALNNRALLRAEVHDTNRAIDDLDRVLELSPDDMRAIFNHAIMLHYVGRPREALADLDKLIERLPELSAAWFLRSEIKQMLGMKADAKRDRDRSIELARTRVNESDVTQLARPQQVDPDRTMTQEEAEARFRSLLSTPDRDELTHVEVYNSNDIKGKVQDRNVSIALLPMLVLTYYTTTTELNPSGATYLQQVKEINDTRVLRFLLSLSASPSSVADEDESMLEAHRASIDYFTSLMATHADHPRAIDSFGRAMDFMTMRDYENAIADLTRAISLTPDFALAYLARAQARYMLMLAPAAGTDRMQHLALRQGVVDDLEHVIRLVPTMAAAWYNLGVLKASGPDNEGALECFNKAIELEPGLGQAWYNRGYVLMSMGRHREASSDLSRAGTLGIARAYNLLKRMTR